MVELWVTEVGALAVDLIKPRRSEFPPNCFEMELRAEVLVASIFLREELPS